MEDYADDVVRKALSQDWVTRHEILDAYLKNETMKRLIPERLSPCQSKYGISSCTAAPQVIALHEYGSAVRQASPRRKQRKISSYFRENDRPR